jgi:LacI family transcriptional regulator
MKQYERFQAFLHWLCRDNKERIRQVQSAPLVREALRMIYERPATDLPLRVSEVVAQFPQARRTLERQFRQVLDCSVHRAIARCRLYRAMRLLRESQCTITDVAHRAGYSDIAQLDRWFQREIGQKPRTYREQWQAGVLRNCW